MKVQFDDFECIFNARRGVSNLFLRWDDGFLKCVKHPTESN
jgi:hypothetical protein